MRCWNCNEKAGVIIKVKITVGVSKGEKGVCRKCKNQYFPDLEALSEIGTGRAVRAAGEKPPAKSAAPVILPELGACPSCLKQLKYKRNHSTGIPFVACSGYPECKYATPVDLGECPGAECDGKRVYRCSQKNKGCIFIGCSKFPACKCLQTKDIGVSELG